MTDVDLTCKINNKASVLALNPLLRLDDMMMSRARLSQLLQDCKSLILLSLSVQLPRLKYLEGNIRRA